VKLVRKVDSSNSCLAQSRQQLMLIIMFWVKRLYVSDR